MTVAATIKALSRFAGRRNECLGVDLGSHTIKMAQLKSVGGRWTVTNRLTLPVADAMTSDESFSVDQLGDFLKPLSRRPLSNRQACSCVLPSSAVDIRSVEVPPGTAREVDQMATEALRDAMPSFDDRIVKLWHHSISPHDMAVVSGVSVHCEAAESIVDDLGGVGLNCYRMDSLPFALARASTLTPDYRPDQSVGMLDWGHRTVTLVIAKGGRPEFIRSFRDCSGLSAVNAIAEGLKITPQEALAALCTARLFENDNSASRSAIGRAIEQLLQADLQRVADELHKTLMYLRHHASRIQPTVLQLAGGMATVDNIAEFIQEQSGIETKVWSLDASNAAPSDPLFATAFAASVREVC